MILATSSPEDAAAVEKASGRLRDWLAGQVGVAPSETGVIPARWDLLPALMERNIARDMETPDARLNLSPELGVSDWYVKVLEMLRAEHGLSWVTDLGDVGLPAVSVWAGADVTACGNCGKAGKVKVPLIVTERPGLAAQIRSEEFSSVQCPHCGSTVQLGLVFIVWRPRRSPRILLGFLRGVSYESVEATVPFLIENLQRELGDRFRPEWWNQMVVLPHDDLADRIESGT